MSTTRENEWARALADGTAVPSGATPKDTEEQAMARAEAEIEAVHQRVRKQDQEAYERFMAKKQAAMGGRPKGVMAKVKAVVNRVMGKKTAKQTKNVDPGVIQRSSAARRIHLSAKQRRGLQICNGRKAK